VLNGFAKFARNASDARLRVPSWSFAVVAAAGLHAAPVHAAQRDWSGILLRDAQALHDTYVDSHPGAVDPQNPDFKKHLAAGLGQVKERAKSASDYPAYWWAMREYIAGFADAHMFIDAAADAPDIPVRWPGFLTREVAGKHVVETRIEGAGVPLLGSHLVSCDGADPERLSADLIGRFRGRWSMSSQREAHGWRLFLDAGNPYVKLPARCIFSNGATERPYDLSWIPMSKEAFQQESARVSVAFRAPTGARSFATNGLWISMGSFSGDTSTEGGKAISELVRSLKRDKARIADAKLIVLDVRGNGGGSSRWGDEIAALIWGKRIADAAKPQSAGVDWRPSEANIAAVQEYGKAPGTGFFARMFAGRIASGMRKALQAGQPLWREKVPFRSGSYAADQPLPLNSGGPKVYILTDGGCASACLDAMDVWTRAGALPIGRETAADSLYMEIRKQALPSGLASISVPMKVYRGRPRGSNVSYKPVHTFSGDMRDQQSVDAWIAGLR
jgi:hypothetical protein